MIRNQNHRGHKDDDETATTRHRRPNLLAPERTLHRSMTPTTPIMPEHSLIRAHEKMHFHKRHDDDNHRHPNETTATIDAHED